MKGDIELQEQFARLEADHPGLVMSASRDTIIYQFPERVDYQLAETVVISLVVLLVGALYSVVVAWSRDQERSLETLTELLRGNVRRIRSR